MIIPDSVIEGWMQHYNADSALAKQYPEIDLGRIVELMHKDRPIVRDL